MIVELEDGRKFRVRFHYVSAESEIPALFVDTEGNQTPLGSTFKEGRDTLCVIELVNDAERQYELVAAGEAILSPKDKFKFCKRVGRKLAFSRAVAKFPDKDTRYQFWQAFHAAFSPNLMQIQKVK